MAAAEWGGRLHDSGGHGGRESLGFLRQPNLHDLVAYKCTDYYAPECERALRWDDQDIGVNGR